MFRKEINFIADLNFNKLQNLGDKFTIEDLKKSKIHPALIQFTDAAIDKEIFYDRKKIESDSIFDYRSDRINNYFNLISEEIKRSQILTESYVKQIIHKGIIFNVNYLIKPNKALTKLIFDETEIKSIEEIVIGISHAYYYQYLKKVILTYLDKKKVLMMRRDEFLSLLDRIDSISKQTHLEDTLTTAVNSMANFFDPNNKSFEKIPLDAVRQYVRERQLNEYIIKLEERFDIEQNIIVSASEILKEISTVIPEMEIEIKDRRTVEEDLEIDGELTGENSSIKDSMPELIKDNDIDNHGIFVNHDDEDDIPNNQLLSDEKVSSGNDEINGNEEVNDIESDKPSETVKEKGDKDSESYGNEIKKKPDPNLLIRKIVKFDSIYDSLLNEIKPFEDIIDQNKLSSVDDLLKNELDYKLDHFTLADKIEISDSKEKIEETHTITSINNQQISDEFEDLEGNLVPAKTPNKNEDIEASIDNSIDEIVKDERIEKEYVAENSSMQIVDQDLINSEVSNEEPDEKVIDILDKSDEELTEVFADLAFLEKTESFTESSADESNTEELEQEDSTNESVIESDETESQNFLSFSEMVSQKDMTKIIEFIFDYDMEDYHLTLNQISNSDNEEEANKFIENYCKYNHIALSSKEVHQFKSLVSDYYSQAYS